MNTALFTDSISVGAVVLVIAFIFWLSTRQIRTSTQNQDDSSGTLGEERDGLERRVSERTEKLIESETLRHEELERIAEFGKLSQGLFHDLMNPLSAISIYIEELGRSGRAPDAREAEEIVAKAVKASERMRSYMESVRRTLGTPDAIPRTASLKEEILTARDLLAYKARMADTRIALCDIIDADLPIHPIRLHQVFLNLMSNAIDACDKRNQYEKGERTVSLSASRSGSSLKIEIRDDGCGMSRTDLENLFTKQYTTKDKGSGIGLPTVKNIIEKELHGGIYVKSAVNEGSVFTLTIPLDTHGIITK